MTLSREQGVKRRRQSESSGVEPPAKMLAANSAERHSLWNVSLKKLQVCQAVGTERCLRKTVLVYNTLKVIHSTFTGVSVSDGETAADVDDANDKLQSCKSSPLLEECGDVMVAGELISDELETLDDHIELDIYSTNDDECTSVVYYNEDFDDDDEVEGWNKEAGSSSFYDNEREGTGKRCPLTAREGNESKRVCVGEHEIKFEKLGESGELADRARDQHVDVLSSCMMHCCLQTGTSGFRESFYESSSLLEDSLQCVNSDVSPNNTTASGYCDDVTECRFHIGVDDNPVSALLSCANQRSQLSSCALEVANPAGSEHSRLVEILEN
ncbi:uncharacterized protein LOC134184510 [Corticium candelabrum]|uniref:uncharacterized protein LOC134184510 n=1 Tax=Corticium candelabrum TaxID=121492 RepID=UPI002E3185D2|nr:uncharacterized protein LOC134184510 [Corticium candelabrum]